MIPRRFFWFFDSLILATAFLLADLVVPRLVAERSVLLPWLAAFYSQSSTGQLPPLTSMLWMLALMIMTTITTLEGLGGYRAQLAQSGPRSLLISLFAPLTGLSLITVVLFALHSLGWSRLFIFIFALMSAVGLAGYRSL